MTLLPHQKTTVMRSLSPARNPSFLQAKHTALQIPVKALPGTTFLLFQLNLPDRRHQRNFENDHENLPPF
jgi:hypothetical protein